MRRHNERAKQLLRTEVAVMSRIRKLHHPNLMSFKHTFEVGSWMMREGRSHGGIA